MGPGEVAAILFGVFAVLVILRVPVAFALGLAVVPVFFINDRLTPVLLLREMFKSYNAFVLLAVPFFLLAANLMNSAGITDRLIRLARAMVGHLPGGLGHINVVVSMLFAGISGSSTADAAGIGSLLIPQMKKQGYDTSFAVAITACSSVMGVIIPPSILMVVWGGLMSVSIGGLFLAGVIPGVLIAGSQMLTVYIYAKRRGYPIYDRSTFLELMVATGAASLALMTPLIIVGGIVGGFFTPTEASVVAVVYSLILGIAVYRSVTPAALPGILYDSGRFAAISLFCIGTASAFGWCLAFFKIPAALVAQIELMGLGLIGTGIMCALAFLVIGMFIDAIPAIIILGTVLYPVTQHVGMHPIHFAIIGVISLAFGLVTPPYGLCLLITAAIGKIRLVDALRDVAIILLPMLLVLAFVIAVPDAILALPRWIMPKFIDCGADAPEEEKEMARFQVRRPDRGFGAEVTGLDLGAEVEGATVAALRRTFHENQLMVIRGQDITPQRFLWFARHFGEPQPHILAHLRHKQVPEILPLSNIFENGKPIGVFDGAAFWHQDMAYEDVASNATIVHALEVPEKGGETLFADMWAAYDALDTATRAEIAGLVARHRYGNRADEQARTRGKAMELTEEEQKEVHDVYHPIVLAHPVTGRPALYGVTSTSRGIVGMDDGEARELLDRLAEHAAQDRFVQAHRYEVGDIVLWDNFSLMHRATLIDRASGPGTRRYLHRISTKDLPAAA